jgi:hypothetical protein
MASEESYARTDCTVSECRSVTDRREYDRAGDKVGGLSRVCLFVTDKRTRGLTEGCRILSGNVNRRYRLRDRSVKDKLSVSLIK